MREDLERRGAVALIIGGGPAFLARTAARLLDSPWPLLLDEGRAVCQLYGLGRGLLVINESGTTVVDRNGVVRFAGSGLNPSRAFDRRAVLAALDSPATA